uniref:Uncharacterized protein n=1 Tax=viral metagenome TaxID=1070528 RepID=A0A6C0BCR7_9ZZZZ
MSKIGSKILFLAFRVCFQGVLSTVRPTTLGSKIGSPHSYRRCFSEKIFSKKGEKNLELLKKSKFLGSLTVFKPIKTSLYLKF